MRVLTWESSAYVWYLKEWSRMNYLQRMCSPKEREKIEPKTKPHGTSVLDIREQEQAKESEKKHLVKRMEKKNRSHRKKFQEEIVNSAKCY